MTRQRGCPDRAVVVAVVLLAIWLPVRGRSQEQASTSIAPPQSYRRPLLHAHPGQNGPLSERELGMARVAWRYFENNYQTATGLVNAVDKYPSTTMWDTASYIAAIVSAHELGLISRDVLDQRLALLLRTLNTLPFFRDELPNKVYNTQTAAKVNYANKPGEIGFSALDLGRMLVWLKIVEERYPTHANAVDRFVLRWKFCNVVDACGTLFGAVVREDKSIGYLQEGRLGYEEYAAKGFQLWGFDTTRASKAEPYDVVPIFGVQVPYDTRDPRRLGGHNYVVSESYVLDGIELNWDLTSDRLADDSRHSDERVRTFADRVYLVQQRRFERTGLLTARTEHQLDRKPYFVYDTVYSDGYPWNTIDDGGQFHADAAAVAVKGAIGLWALWETPYTARLFDAVSGMYDKERGFYEGIYENGSGPIREFTANNNGILLECLLYKTQGKLLKFGPPGPSLWRTTVSDQFGGSNQCLRSNERRPECGR